jgi:MFS family permease
LTLRLAEEWNYNTSQIGLAFLAQVLPGFASGPLAGYLADKFGAKIVILTSTVISAVMLALLGVPNSSTGIAPLIVLLVLEGFFGSAVLSPVLSEIAAVVELENKEDGSADGFAKSYAVFNIAFAGGMLVGPLLGGFVYSAIGFFWLNIILACALVVCLPPIYFWIGTRGGGLIQRPAAKADADKEVKVTDAVDEDLGNNDGTLDIHEESLSKVPTVEEVPVSNDEEARTS